jgi:hypothetical protein
MSLQDPSHKSSTPQLEPHARKRPASERKILANRRNALRSTGPKTEVGRRAVSRNAITHGILAREVVITAGDGEESLEEFHALVESLANSYLPVGVVEETLVQTIATALWRKTRVIRAENGEIRKQLDSLRVDRALRNSNKANLHLALTEMGFGLYNVENPADGKVSTAERWSAMQAAQCNLREDRSGLGYLTALLKIAKSEITTDGHLSERIAKQIFSAFGLWNYFLAISCLRATPPEVKTGPPPSEKVVEKPVEQEHADVIALIEDQLEMLGLFKEYASEREKLAADAEARSFNLPSADATDKLLRYEAHLDRQLYRAMDQLERLQRQRKGENVPPPLNVNLGHISFLRNKAKKSFIFNDSLCALHRLTLRAWRVRGRRAGNLDPTPPKSWRSESGWASC